MVGVDLEALQPSLLPVSSLLLDCTCDVACCFTVLPLSPSHSDEAQPFLTVIQNKPFIPSGSSCAIWLQQ